MNLRKKVKFINKMKAHFCEEGAVFLDFFVEKTYPIDSCEHYLS